LLFLDAAILLFLEMNLLDKSLTVLGTYRITNLSGEWESIATKLRQSNRFELCDHGRLPVSA